jgi:hypothetical protein
MTIMKRNKLLILLIVFITMLLAAMPTLAAPAQPFYLEKVCDMPNSCLLQNATPPFDVLNGGRIYYFDHAYFENPGGNMHESAAILLTSADGQNTLLGNVSWVMHGEEFRGKYILQSGTGVFEGAHVKGVVEVVSWDTMTFSLTGDYFFMP